MNKQFEFNPFMEEIKHLITSRKLYGTIFSLIDEDDDNLISKHEWSTFFDNITSSGDGSKLAAILVIIWLLINSQTSSQVVVPQLMMKNQVRPVETMKPFPLDQ